MAYPIGNELKYLLTRSFYFYESEKQIIFTHGFVKKSQKTPKSEIAKAKSIRELWRGKKMSIAEKYFEKQFSSEEFRHSFLEEKVKLDIEYRLEDLKKDIQTHKSPEELIEKLDSIANGNQFRHDEDLAVVCTVLEVCRL
jgi:hypothetical protein